MKNLDELIQKLAYHRNIEAEYKQEIEDVKAEIKASYGHILERVESLLGVAKADVADAEADVRKAALATYGENGEKQVHPAVTVKVFTVLDYSLSDALEYARQHLPKALKLDKRSFEKVAKAAELDFVAVSEEPRATISRDLSNYLA
jgi:NAD+--asparagine ADP-ribosyltransferase